MNPSECALNGGIISLRIGIPETYVACVREYNEFSLIRRWRHCLCNAFTMSKWDTFIHGSMENEEVALQLMNNIHWGY